MPKTVPAFLAGFFLVIIAVAWRQRSLPKLGRTLDLMARLWRLALVMLPVAAVFAADATDTLEPAFAAAAGGSLLLVALLVIWDTARDTLTQAAFSNEFNRRIAAVFGAGAILGAALDVTLNSAAENNACELPRDVQCVELVTRVSEPPVALADGLGRSTLRVVGPRFVTDINLETMQVESPRQIPDVLGDARIAAGSTYGELVIVTDTQIGVLRSDLAPMNMVPIQASTLPDPTAIVRGASPLAISISDHARQAYITTRTGRQVAVVGLAPAVNAPPLPKSPLAFGPLRAKHNTDDSIVWLMTPNNAFQFDYIAGTTLANIALPYPAIDFTVDRTQPTLFAAIRQPGQIIRFAGARYAPDKSVTTDAALAHLVRLEREDIVVALAERHGIAYAWNVAKDRLRTIRIPGGPLIAGARDRSGRIFVANRCGLYRLHLNDACFAAGN